MSDQVQAMPTNTPAPAPTVPDPLDPLPAPTPPPATEVDMASFAKMLGEIVNGNADESKIETVMAALANVPLDKAQAIVDHPLMQKFSQKALDLKKAKGGLRPGEVVNKGTTAENYVPWAFTDLKSPPPGWDGKSELPPGHTEWVWNWVPERNLVVTINGLSVRLYRRVPFSGPKCFYDQYMGTLAQEEAAAEHAAYIFRSRQYPGGPEVGPPRDPTIMNEGTMQARMRVTTGSYFPGMGTQGMAAVPAGDGGEAAGEPATP